MHVCERLDHAPIFAEHVTEIQHVALDVHDLERETKLELVSSEKEMSNLFRCFDESLIMRRDIAFKSLCGLIFPLLQLIFLFPNEMTSDIVET